MAYSQQLLQLKPAHDLETQHAVVTSAQVMYGERKTAVVLHFGL